VVTLGDGRGDRHFQGRQRTLNFEGCTLQNGNLPAAGAPSIWGGRFIADKVTVRKNQRYSSPAPAINGGAILDDSGDLTVTNSILKTTSPPAAAGGLHALRLFLQ